MIYKPPILQAMPNFGTESAPRYAIQNLVNGHYWTGKGFSPNADDAMLYAQPNDSCIDMREIMLKVYDKEPLVIYDVPVRVEVFGDVQMKQVQHFLSRAALLRVRTGEYGNGPHGSLVIPSIHWAEMERGTR